MSKLIVGDHVGRLGKLGVGCSATVFDADRQAMLLIRRADNGRWAVPGGYMEPGEDFNEACAREVFEETGLCVSVVRLVGVYTNPHALLEYPDGNRWQLVVLHFEARLLGGELATSDESTEVRYFSRAEMAALDLGPLDRLRVDDAFAEQSAASIHNVI